MPIFFKMDSGKDLLHKKDKGTKSNMFSCQQTTTDGIIHLTLEGKLNALTAAELKEVIQQLNEQQEPRVLVQVQALQQLDSSGVGALVSLLKRTKSKGGTISLVGLQGQPKEIFKLLNLDQVFPLYDDVDEATQAL